MRKQILGFRSLDLRHRLARAADGRVVGFRHPQIALEQALALQQLTGTDLDHPAVHFLYFLLAPKLGIVQQQSILGEQGGLDLANIPEVFIGELQILQHCLRLSHQPLGPLLRWGEDNLANLAVFADPGSALVEFFNRDALLVGVVALSVLCFTFTDGNAGYQVGGRLVSLYAGR